MRRWTSLLFPLLLLSCTHAEKVDLGRLKMPPGFHIAIFAEAPHARMMVFSPGGVLLATETSDGKVVAFADPRHTGHPERTVTLLDDLNAPHGIAFHNGKLYVAETNQVRRYDWDESQLRASNGQVIARLPSSGGGHFTRTLLFANGKMYVSVGSSCNVCVEEDRRRATVLEFNDDGSGERIFASGMRNAVGLALNPKTGTIWTTENGRDWLGDNLPPDEINDLGTNGGNFGWPYCYGNRVTDTSQTKPGDNRCQQTIPPKVEIQAHSAPLGLAFYTGSMFPAEYRGDLFVALHGSWNRSMPTGYKVIRTKLNSKSEPQGVEDFITGWLRPEETSKGVWMGRPVGIVVGPEGAMYVSDDSSGVIYRITWEK
ncbi:MAG TPA: PQQ-dependent sugar dehydrogenase [Terriglobales bacterium]|nr:PQQ-dependent sugar dehydrogenase [Terriglobales bacterium]